MSESRKIPAELLFYLIFGILWLIVTAVCLAGCAQLMAVQGYSGSFAVPLSIAAIGIGSLCSGWAAAFRKKERGLLTGLFQSTFPVILLIGTALLNDAAAGSLFPLRILAVALCSAIGGVLGVACRTRRHVH